MYKFDALLLRSGWINSPGSIFAARRRQRISFIEQEEEKERKQIDQAAAEEIQTRRNAREDEVAQREQNEMQLRRNRREQERQVREGNIHEVLDSFRTKLDNMDVAGVEACLAAGLKTVNLWTSILDELLTIRSELAVLRSLLRLQPANTPFDRRCLRRRCLQISQKLAIAKADLNERLATVLGLERNPDYSELESCLEKGLVTIINIAGNGCNNHHPVKIDMPGSLPGAHDSILQLAEGRKKLREASNFVLHLCIAKKAESLHKATREWEKEIARLDIVGRQARRANPLSQNLTQEIGKVKQTFRETHRIYKWDCEVSERQEHAERKAREAGEQEAKEDNWHWSTWLRMLKPKQFISLSGTMM